MTAVTGAVIGAWKEDRQNALIAERQPAKWLAEEATQQPGKISRKFLQNHPR